MVAVLLVEDEKALAQEMRLQALDWCDVCDVCHDADTALQALRGSRYDLLVLDIMLGGGISGLDLLAIARKHQPQVSIILVTARNALEDRLRGLRDGADDYLVKPFAMPELAARAHALLRRSQRNAVVTVVSFAHISVDALARTASVGSAPLELAPREWDLLALLIRHAPQIVSRDQLAREIWKGVARATPLDNVMDVHIARLRKKLLTAGADCQLDTWRGHGFALRQHIDEQQR